MTKVTYCNQNLNMSENQKYLMLCKYLGFKTKFSDALQSYRQLVVLQSNVLRKQYPYGLFAYILRDEMENLML